MKLVYFYEPSAIGSREVYVQSDFRRNLIDQMHKTLREMRLESGRSYL